MCWVEKKREKSPNFLLRFHQPTTSKLFCVAAFYQNLKKGSQWCWLGLTLLDSIGSVVMLGFVSLGSIYGGCDFDQMMARLD